MLPFGILLNVCLISYCRYNTNDFGKQNLELNELYEVAKTTKLQMSDVQHLIKKRLKAAGFMLSPSQEATIGDGNCFLYATEDQLR